MSASDPRPGDPTSVCASWEARLARMGLPSRTLRGGRTVIATLSLSERPFPGLEGPVHIRKVMFATAGRERIKCMKPDALFALPLVSVSGCESPEALEVRIRTAWTQHMEELGSAYEALRNLDAPVEAKEPATVLRVAVEGEGPDVWARLVDERQIILPSRGPLSGVTLRNREERLLFFDPKLPSGSELQIAISNRLEEFSGRTQDEERDHRAANIRPGIRIEAPRVGVRTHRVLLVGPQLCRDRALRDSLALRGYAVVTARGANDALRLFHRCSPEIILTDADLGRGEGLDLLPLLGRLAGVEEVPVIVVDSAHHSSRRKAARTVGAAGYLVHPIDVARIADHLRSIVDEPRRRRFTRYCEPLAVRVEGARSPCTATALSRGGLYLCSSDDFAAQTVHQCELVLPDRKRSVHFEAEVLYRLGQSGHSPRGVGLRFERFGSDGEPEFLDFIESLEENSPTQSRRSS